MRLVNKKYHRYFSGNGGQRHNKCYFIMKKRLLVDSMSEPLGEWDMTFMYPRSIMPWWKQ